MSQISGHGHVIIKIHPIQQWISNEFVSLRYLYQRRRFNELRNGRLYVLSSKLLLKFLRSPPLPLFSSV
jgi:hypothetical protein